MEYPDIFLGGAPKCGTSSVFDWMAQLDSIQGAEPKETFYHIDRDSPLLNGEFNTDKSAQVGYHDCFFKGTAAKLKLDGTTHILYQTELPDALAKLSKKPKMIFCLRSPADRLYSSFSYTLNNIGGFKKELSFSAYVDMLLANEQGKLSDFIDRDKSLYVLQRDLEYGIYNNYLTAWERAIGHENIMVVDFEELKSEPKDQLKAILEWLNIDSKELEKVDFRKKNETYEVKNKQLHRQAIKLAKRLKNSPIKGLLKKMYGTFAVKSGSSKKDDDLKAIEKLKGFYFPYNSQLVDKYGFKSETWH